MADLPALDAFRRTHERLRPHVFATPTVPWPTTRMTERLDCDVFLKLELLQKTGTFKVRGALGNIEVLGAAPRVTAVSAGNHAIATAYAAQAVGGDARVVMYDSANPARVALTRAWGADVVFARPGAEAFALMDRLVEEEGRTAVHPFEGERVTLATGGVALEMHAAVPDLDVVIVAVGGGGLASGVAAVTRQLLPDCAIYGVEPVGAASMSRSIAAGEPVTLPAVDTIADSLAAPMALPWSWGICSATMDDVVTVTDDDIAAAALVLFDDTKFAVEPACAAATAALLGPLAERVRGKRVGVILCGSNIDAASVGQLLARGADVQARREAQGA